METDFLLNSYHYDLDPAKIAQRPWNPRDESKLLVYDKKSDSIEIIPFFQLSNFIPKDSLIILNNSQVVPSRVKARKPTGGNIEVFFLDLVTPNELGHYKVLLKSNHPKKLHQEIILPFRNSIVAKITKIEGKVFELCIPLSLTQLLDELKFYGEIPIPPYIRHGNSDAIDKQDYQCTYADSNKAGSIAAPTAGLHFTPRVFNCLKEKNITWDFVSLFVGAGTFFPITSQDIRDHAMHEEFFSIPQNIFNEVKRREPNKQNEKKIFAVGTTSLRVLESAYQGINYLPDVLQSTNIFLHPGKKIESIDGLITNFHLPCSSLIVLVSSLIGRSKTLELYQYALQNNFRFYSYGDAMLVRL